jgi:threonine/homoserine/homoserine lactone efflux protein
MTPSTGGRTVSGINRGIYMPSHYSTFIGLAILLVVAPGPDFTVVTRNSLAYGRRMGIFTSVGGVVSLLMQGAAAALGVSALVVHSSAAFDILKIVGAVYLGYLGLQSLVTALSRGAVGSAERDPERASPGGRAPGRSRLARGFRQGFMSNITNPNTLVFYVSLLPQFVQDGSPVLPQVWLLATTHALLALGWRVVVVMVLGRMLWLLRRPRVRRAIEGLTGLALIGFGIRLITAGRGL